MADIKKCVVDYKRGQGNIGKTYEICLSYVPEKENPRFADKKKPKETSFEIRSKWEQDFKVLDSKERPIEEYIVIEDENGRELAYRYLGGDPIVVKVNDEDGSRSNIFFGQFVDGYDKREKVYGETNYLSVTMPVLKSDHSYRNIQNVEGWLVIKPNENEIQKIKYGCLSGLKVDQRGWAFIPAVRRKAIEMDSDEWFETNSGYRYNYEYLPLEVYTAQEFQSILNSKEIKRA